jgi:SAM-dependent methyltransferase
VNNVKTAPFQNPHSTGGEEETNRLMRRQCAAWKRILDVQAPYRWNLRRIAPGFTLEIGCGIGRNLEHLRGKGIGIDRNRHSVEFARSRGLAAFTPQEFECSSFSKQLFDSILLSHVAEHMSFNEVVDLLRQHLPCLTKRGSVILVTPQEVGFHSDPSHVEFMDFEKLEHVLTAIGFGVAREYSFPFPRFFGRLFVYNEFVVVGNRKL